MDTKIIPKQILAMLGEERISGKDRLPGFTDYGCYPLVYYAPDGEAFCRDCATEWIEDAALGDNSRYAHERGTDPELVDVYYEGPTLNCVHCDAAIESSYWDPDAVG